MKQPVWSLTICFIFLFCGCAAPTALERSKAYFKQGKTGKAIELLQEKAGRGTASDQELAYLGTLFNIRENTDLALQYYRQAARLKPDSPYYLNNVALTYDSLEQEMLAREWFHKTLEADPENKIARFHLEAMDRREAEYRKKLRNLEKKVEPKEETFEEYLRVGKFFFNLHRWALAEKYLLKADQLNSGSYEVKKMLARLAYRKNDPNQALRRWEEAVKIEPGQIEGHVEAGRLQAALMLYKEAALSWETVRQLSQTGESENEEAAYYLKYLSSFLPEKRSEPE